MKRKSLLALVLAAVAAAAVAAALGMGRAQAAPKLTHVTLQLKWVTQSQFAGYYAAVEKGYYTKAGLDVTLKVGGPDITPEQVVLAGQADFGLDWLPNLFATREKGGKIVSIAQVFARSGMTELTWKDSGINTIKKMAKKKVGVWCCGNQPELFAALTKNGINPASKSAVTIVNQPFDMNLFLQRKIDAAAAMTYNELAQVLETKNPATGKLYTLADLRVFKYESLGTGMLQDAIFVRGDWIRNARNQATARKFLEASFKGWIWCRDHYRDCVNIVLKNGPTLGRGHQTWQMNEINRLIWPSPTGVGVMWPAAAARTVAVAIQGKLITKKPTTWYRTDLAKAAVAALRKQGIDVSGRKWKPAVVKITEGGK